jgi:hypothetical protein
VTGRAGRPFRPELVDEPVTGHNLVRVKHEEREQRPLLRTADRNRPAVANGLERPEQSKFHLPPWRL